MKRLLLCIACIGLFALGGAVGQAHAQITAGGAHSGDPLDATSNRQKEIQLDEGPVNPVPEPGTMALASMGLIAIGAAARRRRAR